MNKLAMKNTAWDSTVVANTPRQESSDTHMRNQVEQQFANSRALGTILRRHAKVAEPIELLPDQELASIAPRATRVAVVPDNDMWPVSAARPDQPLKPPPGLDCYGVALDKVEIISVVGRRGENLEQVLVEVATRQKRNRDFRPVFVTDQADFTPFVRRGYAFEYLPQLTGENRTDVQIRMAARKAELTAKWGATEWIDMSGERALTEHPHLSAICAHNAVMSRQCHQDRFAWAAETLRLALSTERYDVAADLAEYLLGVFDLVPNDSRLSVVRSICRKMIAFGETETVQRFLFKNINLVRQDDQLYTWFSTYCTGAEGLEPQFSRLPSGKPNIFYLAKRLRSAQDSVLATIVNDDKASAVEPTMLMANYFAATGQSDLFKMFFNRAFAEFGTVLKSVDLTAQNVLDTMTFARPDTAATSRQKVSVIMSCYNAETTVGYAVRSILEQNHENIELLICDDGSDDGSMDVLASLPKDPRVKLFRSRAQQGTYNIRNALIAEATGQLVTFQDSDDLAFPDRLARQITYLNKCGAAAVTGLWHRISPEGEFVFSSDHRALRLAVVSLLAPKHIFESFGPYRSARFGADTELYEKLRIQLGMDAVRVLPEPLLLGLSESTSLTRSAGIEANEDGYRGPARRRFADAAAALRLGGYQQADSDTIDQVLAADGNLMPAAGVVRA